MNSEVVSAVRPSQASKVVRCIHSLNSSSPMPEAAASNSAICLSSMVSTVAAQWALYGTALAFQLPVEVARVPPISHDPQARGLASRHYTENLHPWRRDESWTGRAARDRDDRSYRAKKNARPVGTPTPVGPA